MAAWLEDVQGALNEQQRDLARRLDALIHQLDPTNLDDDASHASADGGTLSVRLAHANRPDLNVELAAYANGEVVVSYGHEHEHFRPADAADGRVWPFPSDDSLQATLSLVEGLLTGRVVLQVWTRPLAERTRSYWLSDAGEPELFMRGGTLGPFLGWSRHPRTYRFDFGSTPEAPERAGAI